MIVRVVVSSAGNPRGSIREGYVCTCRLKRFDLDVVSNIVNVVMLGYRARFTLSMMFCIQLNINM